MQAIITAGGLGTRMLPISKEIPKEMLPVPVNGELKPIIQVIFEQLYDQGVREFIVVVSRSKRVIEDYFTPDYDFLDYLEREGKLKQASSLRGFYERIEGSNIVFLTQYRQRGFGEAVLRTEPYVGGSFLVVAADTLVFDLDIGRMSTNSFLVTEVEDPRPYGVVITDGEGNVIDVEEKPKFPRSNLIIIPYYVFDERIFQALKRVHFERELQLTDGIRNLIREGVVFKTIRVKDTYDLGNFEGYVNYLRRYIK
ncbi:MULTISPECIES: sugar phosphate nucleotidyltransferase [Saccharolobus]|uniref:sugar phosphate nucleotidyltransferase n=1 Tax=Saccharolobus TaxID=2100760 RepID=UPI001F0FC516|nr:sugar phosphate nucleotidyltransferase [Saccharolobus shibatae]MCH4816831.1 UTP--glucose-1-phosphate uridylyltransferase [Saccharolobus shibatae]